MKFEDFWKENRREFVAAFDRNVPEDAALMCWIAARRRKFTLNPFSEAFWDPWDNPDGRALFLIFLMAICGAFWIFALTD